MKKIIALILALVLILSMSISVSAVNSSGSAFFYVYLENLSYNIDELTVWFQPEECTDDVLPEGKPTDPEFEQYIAENWAPYIPGKYETKENLYAIFLVNLNDQNLLEQNITGNFVVVVFYTDPISGEEQYYSTDLLNFFNEEKQNTVVTDFGDETAEPAWRYEKTGYIEADGSNAECFVFGTRGEAITTGDVISVDLEWGGMEFVYTPEQTVWNPNTHEYEPVLNEDGSSPSGWSVAEGSSNHITITNHSNVAVEAALEFTSADGKNINGYFDNSVLYCASGEDAYNSPEKAPSDSTEFNIIRCEIDKDTQGELGTITITIRHMAA